jgi:FAD/FMN-containing dehydrogenase
VLRYGMARDQVLGLEVVLPDGSVWDGLRGLRKDNTGYDLKQLFIGAEGTLGIITAAVLKLSSKPRDVKTAWVAVPDADAALELLIRAREASGDAVTAFELVSRRCVDFVLRNVPNVTDPLSERYAWHILIELSSSAEDSGLDAVIESLFETAIEDGLVLDGTIAASEAQAKNLWALREYISEAQKPEGGSIKHDVSVPVSRVPEFLRRADAITEKTIPGSRPVTFGHAGDGNIHYNVTQPEGADTVAFLAQWDRLNEAIHDLVHEMNGSFSAEHGVGQLKRAALEKYRSPVEVALMRKIKAALDPNDLMNPGKVV